MWQQLVQSKDQILQAVGVSRSRRPLTSERSSVSASTKRHQIPPCSDLYDLVLAFDWEQVLKHCQEHPQDAQFQEGDGLETPLYLACQWNPPTEVIQALIQAYPEALQTTSREHRDLPVHCICRYATTTVEMLHQFMHLYPSTVVHPTKHGKTALQVLWGHARPDCIKQSRLPASEEEQLALDDFWNKMELLVQAVAIHRQQSWPSYAERELHLVHAVVSLGALGCPLEVLEYICDKYPQQLRQRDGSGRLPLHLAVGPALWSPSSKRKYKPREQEIIRVLLQKYSGAARVRLFSLWDYYDTDTMNTSPATTTTRSNSSNNAMMRPSWKINRSNDLSSSTNNVNTSIFIDRSGRYPLHIALANRHTWDGGVQEIFLAAPEILSFRDPVTQLYPFQLAAIPVGDTLVVNATTIWELLRLQPDLVEDGFGSDDDTTDATNKNDARTDVVSREHVYSQIDTFSHNGYPSRHHAQQSAMMTTTATSTDCTFYAQSKKSPSSPSLFYGLGVAVAVGAGIWCLTQQHASLSRSRSQSSLSS